MIDYTEDIAEILQDGITVLLPNGSAVNAMFANRDIEVGGVLTRKPALTCQAADLSFDGVELVKQNDQIMIDDTTYYVLLIENTGTGISTITLSKDAI